MKAKTAALLLDEENLVTIGVQLDSQDDAYVYTYICPKQIAQGLTEGDYVVVPAQNKRFSMIVARVCRVDTELDIDVEADHDWKVVVASFTDVQYQLTINRLNDLTDKVIQAARRHRREQVRAALLNDSPHNLITGETDK